MTVVEACHTYLLSDIHCIINILYHVFNFFVIIAFDEWISRCFFQPRLRLKSFKQTYLSSSTIGQSTTLIMFVKEIVLKILIYQ